MPDKIRRSKSVIQRYKVFFWKCSYL